MSTAKFNHFQIGQNATATQNFVVTQGADGSGKIARGNKGATTQDIITWDGAGKVSLPQGETPVVSKLVSGTAIATTSGTSHDFTGIPSWVKRITVMLNGVSTNGTSFMQIQIGSGSVDTTSYNSNSDSDITSANSTTGILAQTNIANAVYTISGRIELNLFSTASNTWVASGGTVYGGTAVNASIAGIKTISGTLDRIRLTTVNGTDVFDAGSVNIMYE